MDNLNILIKDILGSIMYNTPEDAMKNLRGKNDRVFWFESKYNWGFTTIELFKGMYSNIDKYDVKDKIKELCFMNKVDTSKNYISADPENIGATLAEFLGII